MFTYGDVYIRHNGELLWQDWTTHDRFLSHYMQWPDKFVWVN